MSTCEKGTKPQNARNFLNGLVAIILSRIRLVPGVSYFMFRQTQLTLITSLLNYSSESL